MGRKKGTVLQSQAGGEGGTESRVFSKAAPSPQAARALPTR